MKTGTVMTTAETEAIALGREQAHESTESERDRQHEAQLATLEHQQAKELVAMQPPPNGGEPE